MFKNEVKTFNFRVKQNQDLTYWMSVIEANIKITNSLNIPGLKFWKSGRMTSEDLL